MSPGYKPWCFCHMTREMRYKLGHASFSLHSTAKKNNNKGAARIFGFLDWVLKEHPFHKSIEDWAGLLLP